MNRRRALLLLLLLASLAGLAERADARPASVDRTLAPYASTLMQQRDPFAQIWLSTLKKHLRDYPKVTRAALIQVPKQPLFFQVLFVSGAIGTSHDDSMCTIARVDPVGFARSAKRVIFRTPDDYRYVAHMGWAVARVLAVYRNGALFGCKYF